MNDREVQERVGRVETLLEELESLQNPEARATALEAVQSLLDLYGEGLARLLEGVARLSGEDGLVAVAEDELVSHLLILHGLHPVSVEARVLRALEEVRPYMESHGGDVELVGVEGGVARLRLRGSCDGCHASAMTLKLAIERAIRETAPELERVEAEGVAESPRQPLPLRTARSSGGGDQPEETSSGWGTVGGLPQLSGGGLLLKEVSGEPVLFLKLEHDLYAYQHLCPGCGESLESGRLVGAELACPECGHRYDIRRAGRCVDAPHLYLEPVPLLTSEQGIVSVALRSVAR